MKLHEQVSTAYMENTQKKEDYICICVCVCVWLFQEGILQQETLFKFHRLPDGAPIYKVNMKKKDHYDADYERCSD